MRKKRCTDRLKERNEHASDRPVVVLRPFDELSKNRSDCGLADLNRRVGALQLRLVRGHEISERVRRSGQRFSGQAH